MLVSTVFSSEIYVRKRMFWKQHIHFTQGKCDNQNLWKSSMTSLHMTKLTHNALVTLVYLLRHLDDERDNVQNTI